jgi:hypothetical protein
VKYRVDFSLVELDPRWTMVGEAERKEIAGLIEERASVVSAIRRYREITGKGLAESKSAVESAIVDDELGRIGAGPPCPECGKPLRTKKAQQCYRCGADWHKKSPTGDL